MMFDNDTYPMCFLYLYKALFYIDEIYICKIILIYKYSVHGVLCRAVRVARVHHEPNIFRRRIFH